MSAPAPTDVEESLAVRTIQYGDKYWKSILQLPGGTWLGTRKDSLQIWEIDPSKEGNAAVKVFAGHEEEDYLLAIKDGISTVASFNNPCYMCLMKDGSVIVGDGHLLRLITVTSPCIKSVTTIAGDGTEGHRDGTASQAQFGFILNVIYNPVDDSILMNDNCTRVRKYKDGMVTTIAGDGTSGYRDGPALQAQFTTFHSLGIQSDGSIIVGQVSCIRKISVDGIVSTIAGHHDQHGLVDGEGINARFSNISRVLVDASDSVYITDRQKNVGGECSSCVRKLTKVDSSYVTSTVVAINSGILAGYLCSFSKDGDLIIHEVAYPSAASLPSIHIVKISCSLPPYLHKLFHKELSPELEAIYKEKSDLFDNADDNMADITFTVDGRTIPAHRGVLMAGSEYFRNLFKSPMQAGDSSNTEVKETTYEALRVVLKFIYTKDHRDILTADNVLDVYELTERYSLTKLQDHCMWYLQSSSNMEATVGWYIACAKNPALTGAAPMLKSKLIKNFVVLGERHPDLVTLLGDLVSPIMIGYFASKGGKGESY